MKTIEYKKTEAELYTLETYGSFLDVDNNATFEVVTEDKDTKEVTKTEHIGVQAVSNAFVQLLHKGFESYSTAKIIHSDQTLVRITYKR